MIPIERRLSFEALQLRLHPAESRVRKLAAEHPALYVVFDLLVAADGRLLIEKPFTDRRQALEKFVADQGDAPGIRLSQQTRERVIEAARTLGYAPPVFSALRPPVASFEGLDGVIGFAVDQLATSPEAGPSPPSRQDRDDKQSRYRRIRLPTP